MLIKAVPIQHIKEIITQYKTMNIWYKWDKEHFNYPWILDTVKTIPLSPAAQKLIKSLQKQALSCSIVGSKNSFKLSLEHLTIWNKIENAHLIWPKNCMFKYLFQKIIRLCTKSHGCWPKHFYNADKLETILILANISLII